MTTQNPEKKETKWWHVILGIIFGCTAVIMITLYCLSKPESWFYLAGLGISIFLLSLVCLDYMTYNAKKRFKRDKEEIKKSQEIKELIKELPLTDKIALFFPEPVEVLDRHEIRRALVISLTVVYIILLFQGSSMMEYFIWVYFSVIIFYFGSRCFDKYAEIRKAAKEFKKEK